MPYHHVQMYPKRFFALHIFQTVSMYICTYLLMKNIYINYIFLHLNLQKKIHMYTYLFTYIHRKNNQEHICTYMCKYVYI